MTKHEIVKVIINIVVEKGPIKLTELICELPKEVIQSEFDLLKLIAELIIDGNIVSIDYILPQMDYRIKTMLFPKGTTLTVRKKSHKNGYIETDSFCGFVKYKFISTDTIEYIKKDGTKWITHYKSLRCKRTN